MMKIRHFSIRFGIILIFLIYVVNFEAFNQTKKVDIVKFEDVQKVLNQVSDTTVVLHFWATWCRPCLEELPFFERLNTEYSTKKVKFLLISMDFPKDAETSVKGFLARNKVQSKVVLLDEPDYNHWIDLIDKEWSGSIPATLIINTKMQKRKFFEGKVNPEIFMEELKKMWTVTIQN